MINTSFSLLFLAKGLRPILFGKYQYAEQNSEWDLHPTGIHFLTHETEKAWDIPMTWQTIRATDATANDLREAPILFLSGKDALVLDQQQKLALKDYIENGGFVVAEACQGDGCGANVPFDTSFRALMTELFPESKLEPIAENHPIWNANFPIKPNPGWPLLGLQTCCRTSVIYSPRSLSCYWQMDRPNLLKQFNKSIADEIIEIRKLGINIAAYATGRELLQRLSRPKLAEQSSVVLDDRVLTYPRLIPASLTDDAPNAWKNVLRELSASTQFTVSQGKKTLPADFEQMANFPFLFMHGREQFELQPSERAAIKKYVELGNMLFVDSICASDAFSKSFEKEIETIFPGQLKDIPSNHSIWTRQFGSDLSRVELRRPDPTAPNGVLLESTHPQLKGIEIDGRFVLIYSPFDISCAMENAAANQCRGYSKKDAAAIAINVLLYALLVD